MQDVIGEFALSKEQLVFEAEQVAAQMEKGLAGQKSDFAMLPSFLGLPSGQEQGEFLALDFGGTNVRIARMSLNNGRAKLLGADEKPLYTLLPDKNLGTEELFLRIAKMISAFTPAQGGLLGHTFSYPVEQIGSNIGKLKKWTKEINFSDADGINVNRLLAGKLAQIGRADIIPAVLLNDTSAVLLAAAYEENSRSVLGSICGTGHNTAYYEPARGMVINIETGNFRPSCQNRFDKLLDAQSIAPGEQLLEKMVAGNYLARLVKTAARELSVDASGIESAYDLAMILADENNLFFPLVFSIIRRAGVLVAAEYFGIYEYLRKNGAALQKIAIDGSIYGKMPFFKQALSEALRLLLVKPPDLVSGYSYSLKGAAVACTLG